jgi:hypothetical protein
MADWIATMALFTQASGTPSFWSWRLFIWVFLRVLKTTRPVLGRAVLFYLSLKVLIP